MPNSGYVGGNIGMDVSAASVWDTFGKIGPMFHVKHRNRVGRRMRRVRCVPGDAERGRRPRGGPEGQRTAPEPRESPGGVCRHSGRAVQLAFSAEQRAEQ